MQVKCADVAQMKKESPMTPKRETQTVICGKRETGVGTASPDQARHGLRGNREPHDTPAPSSTFSDFYASATTSPSRTHVNHRSFGYGTNQPLHAFSRAVSDVVW